MLILEGPQGGDKSSAVEALAGEWFSDSNLGDLGSKTAPMKLRGVWIQEIAELTALNRAETNELKEFMSQKVDRYRLPWGRSEDDFPRRCIFIGTVNPNGKAYLADLTGNRRFWPVECGRIDLAALTRDRDQLWAEAAIMESRGDPIRLDPSLYGAAKAEQDERLADDPWVEILADYLDGQHSGGKGRVLSMTLLSDALELPIEKRTPAATKKLKAAMALIPAWKYKASLRADGVRSAGYEYAGA
jgi:predicted P-loop ATPase